MSEARAEVTRALDALAPHVAPSLLDEPRRDALAAYLELLMRWSRRINLTGHRTAEAAAEGLLYDAFEIAPLLPPRATVLDVGAGAGGLGTALAILAPGLSIRFVEPRSKRATFLRTVVRTLGLRERLEVFEARVEDLPAAALGANAAVAQAVMPPRAWLTLAPTLVAPGGAIFCLTARPLGDDAGVPSDLRVDAIRTYRWPFSRAGRTVTKLTAASASS